MQHTPAGATRTRSSGGHAGRRCRSGESTSEASIVTTYGDSSRRERCFDKEPQAVFIKALSGRRKPVTMGKNQSMFSTQPLNIIFQVDSTGILFCGKEKLADFIFDDDQKIVTGKSCLILLIWITSAGK